MCASSVVYLGAWRSQRVAEGVLMVPERLQGVCEGKALCETALRTDVPFRCHPVVTATGQGTSQQISSKAGMRIQLPLLS